MNKQAFTVGIKDKSSNWHIKIINMVLDPGNHFLPIVPLNVNWPCGMRGKLFKVSNNGRVLYKEV